MITERKTRTEQTRSTNGVPVQTYDTIVIGGGQAGLATGYYLKRQGRDFTILDAHERIGDSWRERWDSLRLFTPARFNGLVGMPFPAPPHYFPTKDEMGDYLETYAVRFDLPVQTGTRVDCLTRQGDRFVVTAGEQRFEARNVIVAMANYQKLKVPEFAREIDPSIVQMHSSEYRHLGQLQEGGVLIVGASNSGAEIAVEVAKNHPTWVSGREVGSIPFNIDGVAGRLILVWLVLRVMFHRVMTIRTPVGRKVRPKMISKGGILIRTKEPDMEKAGIKRVPITVGVRNGLPLLEDARVLDVRNVIWCTGYHPAFSWIDLPIHGKKEPMHERGLVPSHPGLYFVGLHYLYSPTSSMIHGVSRDAEYIVNRIAVSSTN